MRKMKKNKKLLVLFVVLALLMTGIVGCGGKAENSKYEGKWIATYAEAYGLTVEVKEIMGDDMRMELKGGGKMTMDVSGQSGSGKWSVEGDQFTLDVDGVTSTGTITETTLVFEDMLGMGVKFTFEKEGAGKK
ncbi:MAG: hypothetical protein RR472_04770 [Anaerovoracaceae bacterium]